MKRDQKKPAGATPPKKKPTLPPTKFEIVSLVLAKETKPYGVAVVAGANYLLEDNAQGVMVFARQNPELPDLIPWSNVKVANLRAARGGK